MIRKIFLYLPLLFLSALPAIYTNSPVGYIPCLFIILATLVSLAYAFLLTKSYSQLEASATQSCTRNSSLEFEVSICNRSFLIFPKVRAYFYINDLFGKEISVTCSDFTISSFEKKSFSFDVKFEHIGTYCIGLKAVKLYDLFGIFSFTCRNTFDNNVYVKPKLFEITSLNIKSSNGIQSISSAVKSRNEKSDYEGVRDYVPGDAIKNIHWKLSAHTINYMTRTFENYASSSISLYINFYAPDYPSESLMFVYDALVESVFSIANYIIFSGQEVELVYSEKDTVITAAPKEYYDLEHTVMDFPVISPKNNYSLAELIVSHAAHRIDTDNIIVFTTAVDNELIYELINIKNLGKHPALFYVEPQDNSKNNEHEMLSFLSKAAIPYYTIASASEINLAMVV